MARVQQFNSRRPLSIRRAAMFDALVDEIVEVLVAFGGSAHREDVILRLAVRRGANVASEPLRCDALAAFELNIAGRDGSSPRLMLPFGEGSHRWALTADPWEIADARERLAASIGLVQSRTAAAA